MVTIENSHDSSPNDAVAVAAPAPAESVAEPVNNEPQAEQISQPMPTSGEPAEAKATEPSVEDSSLGVLDGEPSTEAEAEEQKPEEPSVLGAPEAYSFTNQDGSTTPVEGNAVLGAFSEVARELNLSQDAVSKLYAKVGPIISQQPYEAVAQLRRDGLAACKADPEFGGANFEASINISKKAYNDQRLVTPELQSLLKDSGLNSHPEVVRLFYRIGKLTTGGQFIEGGSAPKAFDYRARYRNTKMNP